MFIIIFMLFHQNNQFKNKQYYQHNYKRMSEQWVPKKPNFGPPPPGYIAGLGRGATGFITRSDLGPTQNAKNVQLDDAAYADSKYDSWQGFRAPLFGKTNLDQQDRQAQDAYDYCQRKMEQRRLKQKEKIIEKELKQNKNQSLNQKFIDLKRQLGKISYEQWQSIPQATDSSIKKRKKDKYTPVPDSVVVSLLSQDMNRTINNEQTNKDFRDAKQILLKTNLDKMENSVHGQSVIDKVGYLTQLNLNKVQGQFLGDVKRARILLKSALNSNPKNADLWISAARVQQLDGKLNDSRAMLKKGLQSCPLNEDLWLEAARLQKPQNCQAILIQGLKNIPKSQKLWIAAADKQGTNKQMKSKILRKGLESNPQSVKLWKQIIQLEDLQEAKKLLYKAVQCLPKQIDLWLGLAKIQTYDNARLILNKARKVNPLNLAIWINAAKLQQTQSDHPTTIKQKIQNILLKARQILVKNGNSITRQQWLEEALLSERSNNILTCQMLVKVSLGYGLDQQQKVNALTKDSKFFQNERQSIYTTRFIYKYGIIETKNKLLMQNMINFQRRLQLNKQTSDIKNCLKFGVQLFAQEGTFWSLIIDQLIVQKNYEMALNLISEASQKIQNVIEKQEIILKKIKILKLQNKLIDAKIELQILQKLYKGQKTYIEHIKLIYQMKQYQQAQKLCEKIFKQIKSPEIWGLAFKIKTKISSYQQCKLLIEKGVNKFPLQISLWQLYINFQIQNNHITKARATIDNALLKLSKNQDLYIMNLLLQKNYGTMKEVNFILSKALKACPKSGQLWGFAIEFQPNQTRKKKANIAIQNCGESAQIYTAIGKVFWKENKIDKAHKWLQNAVQLNLTNGDTWSYYMKFIIQKYPQERLAALEKFNAVGNITTGRKWKTIQNSQDGWKMSNQQILFKLIDSIGNQISKLY